MRATFETKETRLTRTFKKMSIYPDHISKDNSNNEKQL